jgi:aspartate aminotransferase
MTGRAAELRAQGRDVISLSAGEPDFPTPQHIQEAAIAAIRQGFTRYTPVAGVPELRRAIVEKLERDNGLGYRSDQILVSSGAKQSCYLACLSLLEAGDEAIIPAPYWVSYPDMVRLAGAEPIVVAAAAQDRFIMTAEQLEAAITERTRLLILNSPCNPSGAVYSRAELAALGEVLQAHPQILILADDIYEHIHWAPEPFTTLAAACPQMFDRTITVNGVSKSHAMTGWRIGFAAGPAWIIDAMATLQSQSTTNACSVSQYAAIAALTGPQDCVVRMGEVFRQRHEWVLTALRAIPGFELAAASGAFYAFPNIERALAATGSGDDASFCRALLEQAGVAVVPGSAFGAPGHLRLSFACDQVVLEAAVERLHRFVRGTS